jgi:hypothetical protein
VVVAVRAVEGFAGRHSLAGATAMKDYQRSILKSNEINQFLHEIAQTRQVIEMSKSL